jgi:hypothetical protein
MGHSCHIGVKSLEGSYPDCLHTDDHPGPPYTLALRVERGFGLQFWCANSLCTHAARDHVQSGASVPCLFPECFCAGWVEPPSGEAQVTRDHEGIVRLQMGPDAVVIENANGAKQSEIPVVFTTMPLKALWALAKLQKYGDTKYGPHNWRGIPENEHVDHAFAHLMADRLGDTSDEHLLHATWRLMAALEERLFNEQMDAGGGPE